MSDDFAWLRVLIMLVMVGSIIGIPILVLWYDGRKARREADAPPADQ